MPNPVPRCDDWQPSDWCTASIVRHMHARPFLDPQWLCQRHYDQREALKNESK